MFMKTPAPYKVNNSPLDPQGGDFPCKKTYTGATGTNSIPVGTPQTLSFTGGATHGGGSCQIALTSEPQPSASTKWQVIHSIMGGCPTNTTDGNLSETNADMVDPSTFQYTVPSDFAPGTYTLGVTWFNRVGNREMYMFCAPVTLTGGSKKKRGVEVRKEASRGKDGWFNKRANYPDLFKANIGPAGSGCGTVSSTDLIFPDPGDSIEYDRAGGSANPSLKGPTACASPTVAPGAAPSAGGSGSAGSSGAPVSSLAPATTTAAASAAATTAAASGSADPTDECSAMSGEASETGSASAASPTAVTAGGGSAAASVVPVPTAAGSASAVATPVASAAPSVAPSAAPSGSAGSTGSTSGGLTGACTSEGMFNCMGGTSYQQCASGMWSPVQPMAAGTSCKVGQSTGLWAVA
ncbi:hypothetical protein MMC10_009898 [Thelotrema lepadinum]|nr:hypothetical protein [Thelotrema lepadinum]